MQFLYNHCIYITIKEKGGYEMYRYKEAYNQGEGEIVVEVKEFETRKETRDYMNTRVKEVKSNNKEWKTYYQDNSELMFEKELRLKKHIDLEDEGNFDIGECNVYYSFEAEIID